MILQFSAISYYLTVLHWSLRFCHFHRHAAAIHHLRFLPSPGNQEPNHRGDHRTIQILKLVSIKENPYKKPFATISRLP